MNKILQNMAKRNMAKAAAMMMAIFAAQQGQAGVWDSLASGASTAMSGLANGASTVMSGLGNGLTVMKDYAAPAITDLAMKAYENPWAAAGTVLGTAATLYGGKKLYNYWHQPSVPADNSVEVIKNVQSPAETPTKQQIPLGASYVPNNQVRQQRKPDLGTSLRSSVNQNNASTADDVLDITDAGNAVGLPGVVFTNGNGNKLVKLGNISDDHWIAEGLKSGATIPVEQYNQYIQEYNNNALRNLRDSDVSKEFFYKEIKSSGLKDNDVATILQAGGEFVRRGNELKVDFGDGGTCNLDQARRIAKRRAK